MDLDLRKVRYFVAVADHLHFGRAARALFIAQPVLSRQVRALERELGCDLLQRTSRAVALTPAGHQLYADAKDLLGAADSAVHRVHQITRGADHLVVGFIAGTPVSEVVRAFLAAHPGPVIDLVELPYLEQDAPLRDGRCDVAFMREPVPTDGLDCVPVGRESMTACLPLGHRLAGRGTLRRADLDGETLLRAGDRGVTSLAEKFESVAAGRGITVMPRNVALAYSRPDLVILDVVDEPARTLLVAVPSTRRDPLVRRFARFAGQWARGADVAGAASAPARSMQGAPGAADAAAR